jgi:hypothetical protein
MATDAIAVKVLLAVALWRLGVVGGVGVVLRQPKDHLAVDERLQVRFWLVVG